MDKVRIEKDSFGEIEVPADHLWGAQTQRSLEHFAISSETMPPPLLMALASVKLVAAQVNANLGLLETGKADAIVRAAREILDELADEMKACAGLAIDIEGHTDTAGPSGVNLRLSARRATAVADYLAARAPATNFTVKAYGETRPIASNRTLEGRRANRRIEFSLPAGDAETETSGR